MARPAPEERERAQRRAARRAPKRGARAVRSGVGAGCALRAEEHVRAGSELGAPPRTEGARASELSVVAALLAKDGILRALPVPRAEPRPASRGFVDSSRCSDYIPNVRKLVRQASPKDSVLLSLYNALRAKRDRFFSSIDFQVNYWPP